MQDTILLFILGSIAKSTILQYRQFIAGGGFATKSRRSYCPCKANGFATAFGGIANNSVVCNRGQYIGSDTAIIIAFWEKNVNPQKEDFTQINF